MGLNTTVFILNDQWPDYEKNPLSLLNHIRDGMQSKARLPKGVGVREVFCHHADYATLVLVGGNRAEVVSSISGSGEDAPLRAVQQAADRLGYRLVKKAKPKGQLGQ